MRVCPQERLLREVADIAGATDACSDEVGDTAFVAVHQLGEDFGISVPDAPDESFVALSLDGHPSLIFLVPVQAATLGPAFCYRRPAARRVGLPASFGLRIGLVPPRGQAIARSGSFQTIPNSAAGSYSALCLYESSVPFSRARKP